MSGIAGIVHFDGAPVESGLIESMTGAMAYRGPDGVRHLTRKSVAFGHCMLHTTPESLEETQPLISEDGSLFLVMDGRVDNFAELRKELVARRVPLRDRSDAELVLRAYEVWNRECLAHIDGDFAFVIWDDRRREAFCARDRMGVKPFHYWRSDTTLVFASDFHAILAFPHSPRAANEAMVAEHLAIRVDNLSETLIEGISRLPPACWQVMSAGRFEERRYWNIDCAARISYRLDSDYAEHFLDLFSRTIERHARCVGPAGAYLSGGIDSSSVLCVAAGLSGRGPIESYSMTYPGKPCDESAFIDAANAACGLGGNLLPGRPVPIEYHLDQISRFRDVCDGPNGSALNPIRALARDRGVRVMLTGYGGDEWFARNPFHYADMLGSLSAKSLAMQITEDVRAGQSGLNVLHELFFRGLGPMLPKYTKIPLRRIRDRMTRLGQPHAAGKWIVHPDLAERVSLESRVARRDRCAGTPGAAHRWMHQLLPLGWNVRGSEINDRCINSFHLEERNPFYDRNIIEFAFSLPEDQRGRSGGKHVIRESMRGILPETIRSRRGKAEFSSLLADTILEPAVEAALACRRLEANGWVDSADVRRWYHSFRQSYADGNDDYIGHVWPLWMAFVLESWLSVI